MEIVYGCRTALSELHGTAQGKKVMKTTHIIGMVLAAAITLGTTAAVSAKKLPWPYGDRAMNELAMRTYAQQQAQKAQQQAYYGPFGNIYAQYGNQNPYVNQYANPFTNVNPYGYTSPNQNYYGFRTSPLWY
jgi:hypothetical protein